MVCCRRCCLCLLLLFLLQLLLLGRREAEGGCCVEMEAIERGVERLSEVEKKKTSAVVDREAKS